MCVISCQVKCDEYFKGSLVRSVSCHSTGMVNHSFTLITPEWQLSSMYPVVCNQITICFEAVSHL